MSASTPFPVKVHPAVPLVGWAAVVALVQLAPLPWLAALGAALLVAGGRGWRTRTWRLARRARWLLLSLFLIFAFATPGVLLLPEWGRLGPTREGLHLALLHCARLALILATLSVLLERMTTADMVCGLHSLLAPFSRLGLDGTCVALRLMLVLRDVEAAPLGRHWREWLEAGGQGAESEPVVLRLAPLSASDRLMMVALFGAAALGAWSLS